MLVASPEIAARPTSSSAIMLFSSRGSLRISLATVKSQQNCVQ